MRDYGYWSGRYDNIQGWIGVVIYLETVWEKDWKNMQGATWCSIFKLQVLNVEVTSFIVPDVT